MTSQQEASDPQIVVCVSTYGRSSLLPRLMAALEAQTLDPEAFEVVVVDNGSADDSHDVLLRLASRSPLRLRPIRLEQNQGPAWARNVAWRASRAPLAAFTDDDCVPEPEWLEAGVAALRKDQRVGVVQGRTALPRDAADYPWTDWTVSREIHAPTPWFEGCNLFFRRETLEECGGFDESLGFFCEETSLGWAAMSAGWERAFEGRAIVRHDLTERGVSWHMRERFKEQNLVAVASRYPAIRDAFWRPWAVHRENALFALAALGAISALRRPTAVALAVPYLWFRRPPLRHPRFLRLLAEHAVVDGAALAGMIKGSLRHRRLIL